MKNTIKSYRLSDNEILLLKNVKNVYLKSGFGSEMLPEIYFCNFQDAKMNFDIKVSSLVEFLYPTCIAMGTKLGNISISLHRKVIAKSGIQHNVLIYNDDEIIPDKYLPTSNSDSIETFLTLLPDLSEHFVYFYYQIQSYHIFDLKNVLFLELVLVQIHLLNF